MNLQRHVQSGQEATGSGSLSQGLLCPHPPPMLLGPSATLTLHPKCRLPGQVSSMLSRGGCRGWRDQAREARKQLQQCMPSPIALPGPRWIQRFSRHRAEWLGLPGARKQVLFTSRSPSGLAALFTSTCPNTVHAKQCLLWVEMLQPELWKPTSCSCRAQSGTCQARSTRDRS